MNKTKNIGAIIGGALLTAYLSAGMYGHKAQEARKAIEPVWEKFHKQWGNTIRKSGKSTDSMFTEYWITEENWKN